MSLPKPFVILLVILFLAAPLHAAQPPVDSPQSLYLQAGKEERFGSMAKAREIYESIVDRFPESEFAVKANDRLLTLPNVKQKTESSPPGSPLTLFTPATAKALPADPLLRQGVETARMKARAESVRRQELERQKEMFSVREGHKVNRIFLAEKQAQWQKDADQKVADEFGMTIDAMTEKLQQLCTEAKVRGECSEEAFYLLSAAP